LPFAYNYAMGSKILHLYDPAKLRATKLLHYHDALWPAMWKELITRLDKDRPDVARWLEQRGPLRNPAGWPQRAYSRFFRFLRGRKVTAYEAACQRF
jgi:hypothetical protein